MRDPELVARVQRATTRLESAWEQWRALRAGPAPAGTAAADPDPAGAASAEYPSSALLGALVALGRSRQLLMPDQARDIAAELSGWNSGELPGQVSEQLVSWPPSLPSGADQPPASV